MEKEKEEEEEVEEEEEEEEVEEKVEEEVEEVEEEGRRVVTMNPVDSTVTLTLMSQVTYGCP